MALLWLVALFLMFFSIPGPYLIVAQSPQRPSCNLSCLKPRDRCMDLKCFNERMDGSGSWDHFRFWNLWKKDNPIHRHAAHAATMSTFRRVLAMFLTVRLSVCPFVNYVRCHLTDENCSLSMPWAQLKYQRQGERQEEYFYQWQKEQHAGIITHFNSNEVHRLRQSSSMMSYRQDMGRCCEH